MPIFGEKKPKTSKENSQPSDPPDQSVEEPEPYLDSPLACRRKIQFYCQLAHGSPTGIISDFTDVTELYSEVASCYGIDAKEVPVI